MASASRAEVEQGSSETDRPPLLGAAAADMGFFTSYEWCLNPLPTFGNICKRANEELARHGSLDVPWQREEVRTNLYLLLSAACCTIDDYMAHPDCDLSPLGRHMPGLSQPISAAQTVLNGALALRRVPIADRVRRTREALARGLDLICEILLSGGEDCANAWTSLSAALRGCTHDDLPSRLLTWRSRIPEAFRCQDMTHHDAIALAERAVDAGVCQGGPVLVLGLRTAGAYFAPLIKAVLTLRHVPVLGWRTIRPKLGMSPQERAYFLRAMASASRVLVVDDHPNTGGTFRTVLEIFGKLGIPREKVVFLAPSHPAQGDWTRGLDKAKLITLPFEEIFKQKLLRDERAIETILRELGAGLGWTDLYLQPAPERLNATLAAQLHDSFEVRSKRVYRVRCRPQGGPAIELNVLAKSAGWGWLGYHAALAGLRLREFVPPFLGFRHGLMFTEWVAPLDTAPGLPNVEEVVRLIPEYIAARAERLRLDEDPSFGTPGARRPGWDTLLRLLRRPYGRVLGPMFNGRLRAELLSYLAPRPMLVDGKMDMGEWVPSQGRVFKVDFEHHNFGGAQQDVVDPCYDLACAIRDFDISEANEQEMLKRYVRLSGDISASERLPLYKLLSGIVGMRTAAYYIEREQSAEKRQGWNIHYNQTRDFLDFQMARHCAQRLRDVSTPLRWSSRLLFLDLDGVFDAELFGPLFQHTTPSGLEALSLLRASGYSVVLNTGRSLEHVKRYCDIYSLPGGIAEYGSVFFDAVAQTEIPLIDERAREQLQRCRIQLERAPGIFVDPGYRWSLRAYRYKGDLTIGLRADELQHLASEFDTLTYIDREADSPIVQKGVDKGTALEFVRNYLPRHEGPVIAIGDSAQDLSMFDKSDIAYVPANFPREYRTGMSGPRFRHLRRPRQLGLLEAARELSGQGSAEIGRNSAGQVSHHFIDQALQLSELPRHLRLWRILGRMPPARHQSMAVRI